jgi:hypothetical protein
MIYEGEANAFATGAFKKFIAGGRINRSLGIGHERRGG